MYVGKLTDNQLCMILLNLATSLKHVIATSILYVLMCASVLINYYKSLYLNQQFQVSYIKYDMYKIHLYIINHYIGQSGNWLSCPHTIWHARLNHPRDVTLAVHSDIMR